MLNHLAHVMPEICFGIVVLLTLTHTLPECLRK